MGWFSHKKEEIPIETPQLPELPSIENEFPANQSLGTPPVEISPLPNSPPKNIEIKSTINSPGEMKKSNFNPIESQITSPPTHNPITPIKTMELSENIQIPKLTKKAEPVYIRLDKFETTIDAFNEIKNKILEIEKLLRKTKEIKMQEEKELDDWERELQIIKTRIESIDKNIFNKLD